MSMKHLKLMKGLSMKLMEKLQWIRPVPLLKEEMRILMVSLHVGMNNKIKSNVHFFLTKWMKSLNLRDRRPFRISKIPNAKKRGC
jgi:hypothetical protein